MGWLLVLSLAGLAACSSGDGQPRAERALPEPITVSSPAFTKGAAIPQRFTCDGDNRSPPLRWSGVPAGTVEVALVVEDPDAPRGTYVHWIVIGLDPANTTLAEGMVPPGARQVRNSAGTAAYTGPCPPGGPAHHYRFAIYALQRPPTLATTPAPRRRSRSSRRPPPPADGWLAPTAAERRESACRPTGPRSRARSHYGSPRHQVRQQHIRPGISPSKMTAISRNCTRPRHHPRTP